MLRSLLNVFRLIELDFEITWSLEKSNQPITMVFDFLRELNAAGSQLAYRAGNVVAIEGDIAGS